MKRASAQRPWEGAQPLAANAKHDPAWQTIGPSAVPEKPGNPVPRELSAGEIDALLRDFANAARRVLAAGFDVLEIHGAHGYLLSSFLSPIANRRGDAYGGALSNRMRFPLEVFEAVRAAWPEERPLGMRFNGTDWDERGIGTEEAAAFGEALAARGCDFVDISTGGMAGPG